MSPPCNGPGPPTVVWAVGVCLEGLLRHVLKMTINSTQDSGRSPQPCPLSFKLLPLTFTRGCPPCRECGSRNHAAASGSRT